MGQSIGSLALQLTANSAGLAGDLSKAGQYVTGFVNTTTSTLDKLRIVAGDVLGKLASGDLTGLVKSLPGLSSIAAAVEPIGSSLVSAAAGAETAKLQFTYLFGSAEKATETLKELKALSLSSGFGMDQLKPAARNLAQAGIAADYVVPVVKSLASVSAITGVQVDELANTLSRMAETGHVGGRELKQLGGPVLEQLAKNLGVGQYQLRQLAEAGTIGPKDVLKALGDVTQEGGKLAGALEARAHTLAGSVGHRRRAAQKHRRQLGGEPGRRLPGGLWGQPRRHERLCEQRQGRHHVNASVLRASG